MSDQNKLIVEDAYENFRAGNISALVAQMCEDCTWELPEVPGVALAGKRTGREGVEEFFATVARDQDVIDFYRRSLWRRAIK